MTDTADSESAQARHRFRRGGLVAASVIVLALAFAATAIATPGKLTQKPGTDGCISGDGTGGACAEGAGIYGASSVTISPDGKNAYVASWATDGTPYDYGAVAIFDRDPATGKLTQKSGKSGCISRDGTGGACAKGVALGGAHSVTVSPDGKSVYVSSYSGVAIFARDPATGKLTQKSGKSGCISEDGSEPPNPGSDGSCTDGVGFYTARSVTASPDGKSV
jgi:DNA-binding beta-propeller fold protein YncE